MFERYTDRARRAVVLAQEEARLLNHNYIGTEHLLLGLLHEGEGVAAQALIAAGFTLDNTRIAVEEMVSQGSTSPSGHIPFTPNAKKIQELGLREALQLGHNYVGGEHIFLGLLRESSDGKPPIHLAAQIIEKLGADRLALRKDVLTRIGQPDYKSPIMTGVVTATLTKVVPDPELKAMRAIIDALDGLDPAIQNRVVAWGYARFATVVQPSA